MPQPAAWQQCSASCSFLLCPGAGSGLSSRQAWPAGTIPGLECMQAVVPCIQPPGTCDYPLRHCQRYKCAQVRQALPLGRAASCCAAATCTIAVRVAGSFLRAGVKLPQIWVDTQGDYVSPALPSCLAACKHATACSPPAPAKLLRCQLLVTSARCCTAFNCSRSRTRAAAAPRAPAGRIPAADCVHLLPRHRGALMSPSCSWTPP